MTTTTSPKKTTITALPDLCLLTIFDSVPLVDIGANVLLTCRQWYSFRRSILARRSQLTLNIGRKPNPGDIDQLIFPILTAKHVALLSTLFRNANIRKLVVLSAYIENYKENLLLNATSLTMLLHLWADKPIHELTLDLYFPAAFPSILSIQFLQAINVFGALRVLKISPTILSDSTTNKVPFPMLAQLKRLKTNIDFFDEVDLVRFCRWVGANYARNHELEIVFPMNTIIPGLLGEVLEEVYASGAPLAQFTGGFPNISHLNFDQWHRMLGHFPRLTAFILMNNVFSLSEMSRALCQLPHLKHLQLQFGFWDGESRELARQKQHHHQQQKQHGYEALPSVRQLGLCLRNFHLGVGELEPSLWATLPHATVFPGLEGLCIEFHGDMETVTELRTMKSYALPYLGCVQLERIELYDEVTYTCSPEQLPLL